MDKTLRENFLSLRANEKEHELLEANLEDSLDSFKHSLLSELADSALQDRPLEVKYEDGLVKLFFKNDFSKSGNNAVMKAVDNSITFKIYIDEPCENKNFDTVSNAIYNVLGVAVVY